MALNIPNTDLPGNSFLKGLNTGSSMFSRLMQARHQNQANQPHASGDVANALYVQNLRQQFGENDPRYIEAKRAHEMGLQGRQSLINYRDILNQTAGIRATSPLGKLIAEGKGQGATDIINRNNPNTPQGAQYKVGEQYYNGQGEPVYNNPRSPQERQAYEQAIGKGTTDAAIRDKIPYAENVKITLDNINPDHLVQFSGPKGTAQLAKEKLKSLVTGTPSQNLLNYETAVTGADTLKKQLRQFWGDSIQPTATEQIGKLTNPSHWSKNPIIAKQQFEQLKKITDQELQTFLKYGTSPVKLNYDEKNGQFYTEKNAPTKEKKSALQKKVESSANKKTTISPEDRNIAKAVSGQVIDALPLATPENIISTAQQSGKSIDEVIQHLVDQAERIRGANNG